MGPRTAALGSAFLLLAGACGLDALGTGELGVASPDGSAAPDDAAARVGPDGEPLDLDGSEITLDGGKLVVPSHVPAPVDPSAPDLVGVGKIDTTARVVGMANASPPPAGLRFEDIGGVSVLYVGAWTVDVDVSVRGAAPLVVIASKSVSVRAKIDASAQHDQGGPGGGPSKSGPGAGGDAVPSGTDDPGGGGGGFGIAGAPGGAGISVPAGAGGPAYGGLVTDFLGGSGGGRGSPYNVSPCTLTDGNGGAGGGLLQITSAVSITIDASGTITAGGGGGRGGCLNGGTDTMSGGGGGSGGTIFLEAPTVIAHGVVAANGGGGGGGAQAGPAKRGFDGADGTLTLVGAAGGIGANPERNGGAGATRAALPQQPGGNYNNAGGGGGAYGRIWMRARVTPDLTGAVVTPAPAFDMNL